MRNPLIGATILALAASLAACSAKTNPDADKAATGAKAAVQPAQAAQDAEAQRLISESAAGDGTCPWAEEPQPPLCVRYAAILKRLDTLGYVYGEPWQFGCDNDWHRKGSEPQPADMAAYQAHGCETHNATAAPVAPVVPVVPVAPVDPTAIEDAHRVRDDRDAIKRSTADCDSYVATYRGSRPGSAMDECATKADEIRRIASYLGREVHTPSAAAVVAASDLCAGAASEQVKALVDAGGSSDADMLRAAQARFDKAASLERQCFAGLAAAQADAPPAN